MPDVTDSLSGPEAAEAAGITYRQLHHWIASGYITPSGVAPRANWSAFTPADVSRITTLGRTGRVGWSPFLVAPVLAEITIGGGDGYIVISRADTDETTYRSTWVRDHELPARLPPGVVKDLAGFLPACVTTIRVLRKDPRVPRRAKIAVALAGVWVISPIDLIPEFLPVIGPLDDIVVVALAFRYAARQIPADVIYEAWPGDPKLLRRLLSSSANS